MLACMIKKTLSADTIFKGVQDKQFIKTLTTVSLVAIQLLPYKKS